MLPPCGELKYDTTELKYLMKDADVVCTVSKISPDPGNIFS